MVFTFRKHLLPVLLFVALYLLINHARGVPLNPFTAQPLSLALIVPVLAGILFGRTVGFLTGFFATLIDGFLFGFSAMTLATVIPHALMGGLAGTLAVRFMAPVSATALFAGHALRVLFFFVFGFLSFSQLSTPAVWLGIFTEGIMGVFAVIILVRLYRVCFTYEDLQFPHRKKILLFTSNFHVWKVMIIIFLALTAVFAVLFYFQDIFITFVLGFALILVTEKIRVEYHERMRQRGIPLHRRKIYGYALLIFWILITVFLTWHSFTEIQEAVAIAKARGSITSQYAANLAPYLPRLLEDQFLSEGNIRKAETYLISLFSQFFTQVSVFVFNAVLIIPLLFYLYFRRKDKLLHLLFSHIPEKYHGQIVHATEDMGKELHGFFAAKVIESLIVGIICCIGFFVAGLKGWLILGMLSGFFNIVPYIGPLIGAIPPLLLALLDHPTTALYVLITVIIAQIIDNLYLQPFMISDKVKIDALLSIVLTLVGAKIFGIFGMVFALPIYIIYKTVLVESYIHVYHLYKQRKPSKYHA